MRTRGLGILSLAVCGLVFTGAGCDQFKSSQEKANDRVAEASKAAAAKKTPTTQGYDTAITELGKAVGEQAASDATKIQARALLAQTEFEAGQHFARELHRIEPEITRALWDISQLTGQIAAMNVTGQAMLGSNPKTPLETVAAKQQEMQNTATAAAEKVKALQGQIAKIEGEIKTLTDQKNQVQAQADAEATKAGNTPEKEAAPLKIQAIESKRKADNLGHQIVKLQDSLTPLQRDLAVEQTLQKNAQDAVAALEQRKQMFEGNWTTVQEQVGKQKELSSKRAAELAEMARKLNALAKQAAEVRSRAVDQLTKSADHYADASRIAGQLATTLRGLRSKQVGAPEIKAWDGLMALYDLNTFKLLEGQVRNSLGNVHASHAKLAASRKALAAEAAKALQGAGAAVPPELAGTADQDLAASSKAADDAFKAAATLMDNVASVGRQEVKPAGQLGQLFAAYGQYLASGKPEDLTLAKSQYDKLKEDPAVAHLPEGMRQVLTR
jgi:hypothetical protein